MIKCNECGGVFNDEDLIWRTDSCMSGGHVDSSYCPDCESDDLEDIE